MNLSTQELQAFYMLSTVLHFSKAADKVHISQSALSQRIQSLERKLGLTLLVRDKKTVRLTAAGMRLLRFCQAKNNLETELFNDLIESPEGKLSGHLRVAGFSSVMHSMIMPALAPMLRKNPAVQFEFLTYNMEYLPNVLMRGEADFVIMDFKLKKNNVNTQLLGHEHYLLIKSSKYPTSHVFLDHNSDDKITKLFLKKQGRDPEAIVRSYVDNIEGVLHGVMMGLGQGVVPSHLLKKNMPIKIIKDIKPLKAPVIVHYFNQPYYSKLHQAVMEALISVKFI
jgi:DNA-binding transcriptional LysR family regulator